MARPSRRSAVPWQVRQGDVFLVRVDSLPANVKPMARDNGRVVLAYGEVTGHAHAITEKRVVQFSAPNAASAAEALLRSVGLTVEVSDENTPTFLEVAEDAVLEHEEHSAIRLPAGVYVKLQQREYAPGELRTVAD